MVPEGLLVTTVDAGAGVGEGLGGATDLVSVVSVGMAVGLLETVWNHRLTMSRGRS